MRVEPRAGDTGPVGDGLERNGFAGSDEFVQRLEGFGAGEFVPPAAAVISCSLLSARIDVHLWAVVAVIGEGGDDRVEVGQDVLVHLDETLVPACLRGADDLHRLLSLLAVLREELGGCPWPWKSPR